MFYSWAQYITDVLFDGDTSTGMVALLFAIAIILIFRRK